MAKTEVYRCDICKIVIIKGILLRGGIHIIEDDKNQGGILGGDNNLEFHYCLKCLVEKLKVNLGGIEEAGHV